MMNKATAKHNPTIPNEVSKKLVNAFPPDAASTGKRVSQEAATAISEALRLFVVDAYQRASIEAECDHECAFEDNNDKPADDIRTSIGAHHVTRITADLLMDYS